MDDTTMETMLNAEESSDSRLHDYLDQRKAAMHDGNEEEIVRTTLEAFRAYEALESYEDAVRIINDTLKSEMVKAHKHLLRLIDKKITLLLKTEDYEAMEKTLSDRGHLVESDEKARIMQTFYRAVTEEGLGEHKQAIATLQDIPDTLSNAQLTSKYLKIAMLALKTDDVKTYREALRKVGVFDPDEKNPMIYLLRADVAMKNDRLDEARTQYETFFLRSGLKNRYLDRYVRILLAEGDYDEALRFFREKEANVAKMVSKKYKREFYLAGRDLAIRLNDERLRVHCEKLAETYGHTMDEERVFKTDMQPVLDVLRDVRTFDSERELLRVATHAFLTSVVQDVSCVYMRSEVDTHHLLQYRKGLLLEKTVSDAEDDERTAFFRRISRQSTKETVWTSPDKTKGMGDVVFAGDLSEDDEDSFFMILTFGDHLDYTKTLDACRMFATMLGDKRAQYKQLRRLMRENTLMTAYLNDAETAMFRVIPRGLRMMNDVASEILGTDKKVVSVETFMAMFHASIYFDDLFKESPKTIRTNNQRTLRVHAVKENDDAFLFLKDITASVRESKEQRAVTHVQWSLNTPGTGAFQSDFHAMKPPFTVIRMACDFHSSTGLFNDAGQRVTQTVHDLFDTIARRYLRGVYAFLPTEWMAILKTTDRRIIKRVRRDIRQQLPETLGIRVTSLDDAIIRTDERRSRFRETLLQWHSRHGGVPAPDDERNALAQTILKDIDAMIRDERMPLRMDPAGSWRERQTTAWVVDLDPKALMGPKPMYEDLIAGQLRAKAFDDAMIVSVHETLRGTQDALPDYVMVTLHQPVTSGLFQSGRVASFRKKRVFKRTTVVFMLDARHHGDVDFQNAASLDDVHFAARGLIAERARPTVQTFAKHLDFVMVDHEELDALDKDTIPETTMVFNHGDRTLKKSLLDAHGIAWVCGAFLAEGDHEE